MTTWLSNLKLSLIQYIGLMAAAMIGALVLALKLQGSRLHKAQIDLLRAQTAPELNKSDLDVIRAKKAFDAERKAYYDANRP